MRRKSESILRQLRQVREDLLEDTEDRVGDGRVEEEEKNDDGSSDSTGSFGFVTPIKCIPEEETNSSKEEGKEEVSQKVDKYSSDW